MSNNFEKNNVVTVKGEVASEPVFGHSVLGEGFYNMLLKVPRLSSECDVIPVTISERLMGDLKVGDVVAFSGQFRSYNKLIDQKSKLMLTLFVRERLDPHECYEINSISLVGYVCKEPIYRTTPFGREISDLLIAVNRAYNKSDYLPCIAWGRNARFALNLAVGEKIEITGRIQSRNYQKKLDDGTVETRTAYEISISTIALAEMGDSVSSSTGFATGLDDEGISSSIM